MRAVIQRVTRASVSVDGQCVGHINHGLLVYLGIGHSDTEAVASKLANKIACLRIFTDEAGKLNVSVGDVEGGVLVIPNFTLLADATRGRRPEFTAAAKPEQAEPLLAGFIAALDEQGCKTASGVFGAHMQIDAQADGPVNIVLDV